MNAKTKSPAPETSSVVIHPAVAPIFYLLSTWRAQGEGCFPTIDSFSYGEELHFSHSPNKVGKDPEVEAVEEGGKLQR
ncbi:hypothetical protein JHK87_038655 [Glycine soja]|nr:hypothetical protein JHK87_038655 [Glycine soja]